MSKGFDKIVLDHPSLIADSKFSSLESCRNHIKHAKGTRSLGQLLLLELSSDRDEPYHVYSVDHRSKSCGNEVMVNHDATE